MVCGDIPVISMVSVVPPHGHTIRTYGADGIFLVQKLCILLHTFVLGFFSKNIHDRQNKQHTFSLNKIYNHLILLLMVLCSLSNCLTRTVFFPSCNNCDMKKYQIKEGKLQTLFSKLVNHSQTYQQTDLQISRIWYIYILLLLMYSLCGGKLMPYVDIMYSLWLKI